MSGDARDYRASPTSKEYSLEADVAPAKGSSRSPADSVADVSPVHRIYYPCFGKIDIKTYIDARLYGFSFQRMHDEWVVMGKPQIDTSHWPRMPGHRGIPTSPADFLRVAEYYDTKLYEQVLLEAQGIPADPNRPLDDFFGSMVTTAAIAKADFGVYRFTQDQPSASEAAAQHMWYQTFNMLLQASIRYFLSERSVCDRLGAHKCVLPLLFGQAHSMTAPSLLENLTFQMQILRNVFPNFGEHFGRCAAARPPQQPLSPSLVVTSPHEPNSAAPASHFGMHQDLSSSEGKTLSGSKQRSSFSAATDGDASHQLLAQLSQPLTSIFIPAEMKGRRDLFAAAVHPSIRCDIALDQVVNFIDSRIVTSTSTSASSASTPASIRTTTPIHGAPGTSAISSGSSLPSSDAGWQRRGHRRVEEDMGPDIESANLTLQPPPQTHAVWSQRAPDRSPSEESSMMTPEEAISLQLERSQGGLAHPYFSSLPTTPTEMYASDTLSAASQEGNQPHSNRRMYASGAAALSMTSTSDGDSRKRTRAEQNREKMKAYHRRVMQQREALTRVLADMTANVGFLPADAAQLNPNASTGLADGDGREGAAGTETSGSIGRAPQESSWSVSLRNKQKQESKARLRKREIEQVHELGLYASYACATLSRSHSSDAETTPWMGQGNAGDAAARRTEGERSSSAMPWRQLGEQQVSDADLYMSNAIVRTFLRHRSDWIALISAEQRLASEVSKLFPSTDDAGASGGGMSAGGDEAVSTRSHIKVLIDRVQMEERAGRLMMAGPDSTAMGRATSANDPSRSPGGTSPSSPFMAADAANAARIAATGPGTYGQHGYMQAGAVLLSPSSSEYGGMVSPSGVIRPAGVDEGGDYFSQDRRRPHESAIATPSVLRSSSGYRYNTSHGQEARMAAQGAAGQLTSPLEHPQVRVSTHFDERSHGAMTVPGTSGSRVAHGASLYHSQPLHAPPLGYASSLPSQSGGHLDAHPAEGSPTPGGSPSVLHQGYRPHQPGSPQYPPNYPYSQQGPYGGA
ncbi:cytochrome P450 monooxygenase [Pseudozyma hubeiensis SY62]|uniref:Cytochrome P450 monooxygenase n=1 Tax=Pseudozyma hubeiensis (strain SY62) TaxID=1305764 RepID=R9NZI2_PSEHS|nr:cytochrome P450 monooxygenase [Pseudozyma hubeiensis SY62]GAC94189.1 cytochrome P450 monooxygenase [Pseudozyma hubeiensis SY62]